MDSVVMNASSSGLTGITNLASQTGTIGSIIGAAVLVGILMGAVVAAHSWNTRGRLYRFVQWLLKNVGSNFCYGTATVFTLGSIWYIGNFMSQFSDSNPNLIGDVLLYTGGLVAIVVVVSIVGYITKPAWNFLGSYVSGDRKKKVIK
jgi:hypothetical protein